ncbi:MAG: DegV family protein [Clostridia bacterium]|nr:DegV family protein [Clostridia bacterium]
MSNFVIIPDTSCDLIKPLRERFGIDDYIEGIVYLPDGTAIKSDIDWETYNPIDFFESMKDKNISYRTACATTGDIIRVYEKHLKAGKDILAITLSSALSGTYQTCELVKNQLLEKYPERKIICVDSMRYSTALSMLVIEAALKRNEGLSLEETAEYIEKNKHCLHQCGPMDDLFFLCKTGRISNFKAFFGTLVGINPIADFNRKGLAEVLGKFKGKKLAFDAVIKYMKKTIKNPSDQIIFVAHSNREAAAQLLKDMIIKEFNPKEVIINSVGMSCGVSIGPGLCAAFYWGSEISEDFSVEKEIMQEIIDNQK